MKLKSYKHFSFKEAERLYKNCENIRLKIHTINWTFATEKGKQNYNKVHYNIYHTTLPKLIEWIQETEEVSEDIISIEKN